MQLKQLTQINHIAQHIAARSDQNKVCRKSGVKITQFCRDPQEVTSLTMKIIYWRYSCS